MKKSGIYVVRNKVNGKCYVGQSQNVEARIAQQKNRLANGYQKHLKLLKAVAEFGIDNFDFEVLELCEVDMLNERELYWIKKLDSVNNGYNGNYHHHARREWTDEDRAKISKLHKNKIVSDETKEKMRKPKIMTEYGAQTRKQKLNQFYQTEEGKARLQQISEMSKNRIWTDEQRKKLSESNKGKLVGELNPNWGKTKSDEEKQKISQANTGKKRSEQHRQAISQAHKGKKRSPETIEKMKKSQANRKKICDEAIIDIKNGMLLMEWKQKWKASTSIYYVYKNKIHD